MSDHSIRLRFIRHFQRLFDQCVQLITHGLREPEVHAQTGANPSFRLVRCVNDGLSKRQIDNAGEVPCLNEQAGDNGRNTVVYDDPICVAYAKRLAASDHNLITHQKSPAGYCIDLASLNAACAGVQR